MGYRQVEHTADVALELWAPTEEELLIEGAKAVIDLMTEGASLKGEDRRTFELEAIDPEDRLVRWLNEVLVAAVSEGFLFLRAEKLVLPEGGLRAEVIGLANAADEIRAELKAATYHDLTLEKGAEGFRAVVVIDV